MLTHFRFRKDSTTIRTGLAEITFLFLLNEMRHHPQLMEAFEREWIDQLSYVLLVELDVGLPDEASVQTFLQVIERTRTSMALVPDPVPGELSRKLAQDYGVFLDQNFGSIRRSRIIEALDILDQLIRGSVTQ
jgi:hypothetical protein